MQINSAEIYVQWSFFPQINVYKLHPLASKLKDEGYNIMYTLLEGNYIKSNFLGSGRICNYYSDFLMRII